MQTPEQKISWRGWNLPVVSVIFFVWFYLYIWLFVEPRLIYHGCGTFIAYPSFAVDWAELSGSLRYPGGMVEYAGAFLSQLYYFSWLGALVATTVAWLMYTATGIILRLVAGKTLKLIRYIPAVMLLMIHNRYDNQLTAFLALSAALWFSVVYEKLSLRSTAAQAAVFLVMFAMLYHIAAGASFVFAVLAMIYELFVGRRLVLSKLFPAVAIGTYLVGKHIFDLEIEIFHLRLLETQLSYDLWVRNFVICIYFFLPLSFFGAGLWQASARKRDAIGSSGPHANDKYLIAGKPWRLFQNTKVKWSIETALLVVVLVVSIFASFNGVKKKLVQVDYFAYRRMWPEVIKTAQKIPYQEYDICCIHDVDRALYYTGRLGDEMFCYPQKLSALRLVGIEGKIPSSRIFMKRSRFFLELGHIGSAERDAFEFMELVGNSPLILEQLATIKLVKGQIEAAKVFLRALSKDLIFGKRGREMLRRLEQDPELAYDETIKHTRSVAAEKESAYFTFVTFDTNDFFHRLLDKNPNNRLAFEYMMAFYLLAGQVDKLAENIWYLNYFGYKKLPRYYEEAIVIYMSGGKKANLYGWLPRPEAIEEAKAVDKIYKLYRGSNNKQRLRNALLTDFGDSYFSYYILELAEAKK